MLENRLATGQVRRAFLGVNMVNDRRILLGVTKP